MTNYIKKLTGKQYCARIEKNPTVIITTGACEIYGPQLPMGSDLLAVQACAERVADQIGAVIAPTVECGESAALSAFSCTFAMPRKILEDYMDWLVKKLISDGMKNFIFLTGHAGNADTASYVIKKNIAHLEGLKAFQIDWWRFTQAHCEGIFDYSGPMCHGHASECGTSVFMYLYPELVDMNELSRVEPTGMSEDRDILQYGKFTDRTPNGTIGDSTTATAAKGEEIFTRCVNRIVEYYKKQCFNQEELPCQKYLR
ncbi:creatininase family protein [uncultured Clostridium sp.]|uniref:creatininase family protein n=1 Tax=uncultured Clostridium sp. TaxID=59620 RepID=UPI0025E2A993|nr:creatininase family protein [uncultured Clostridium sp.]